ncbi:protein-S-isoprenylcysteine O-methyltransferase-like [Bolinopsis microptera]|uniref:protein-S-isoprenylcysteine O-methyltransferase-like n=1 Tax=Bolinopsis microptera TaxID=2820187 RepID=UPI00307A1E02
MVCKQFSIALISYVNPILCTLLLILTEAHVLWYTFGIIFTVAPLFLLVNQPSHPVLYRAYFIGAVASAGIVLCRYSFHTQLGVYFIGLSVFHITEYLLTALFKENKLSLDSFLLNHSTAYHLALTAGMVEYLIEYVNLEEDKFYPVMSYVGGVMIIAGDLTRKIAIITAAENFDHLVQSKKAADHKLVRSGIYSLSRHPSYAGWFYWSIGTQLLLCNPVCSIGYAYASWKFFEERIEEEECYLLRFFGSEYRDYKEQVGIGIPGIKGYTISPEFNEFLNQVKNE